MNKTTLYTGIIYTSIGLALFTIALLGEYPYEAFLWGLGGGSIGTGISLLWRYFYWKRPSKESDYQKRLEVQNIASHDERNIMLRDKSGRIAYMLMTFFLVALGVICSALSVFGVMMPLMRYLALIFCGIMLFQIFLGIVVFNYLSKRL